MVAIPQPAPISPTTPESPLRFALVHDAYGPGPFLAWVLGAYALVFQLSGRSNSRTRFRVVDKDLFVTLSYPVFAGGHVIKLFAQNPGARDKIWWVRAFAPGQVSLEDTQATMAIEAACRVCVAALVLNVVVATKVRESRRRRLATVAASIWVLFALLFASCGSGWVQLLMGTIGRLLAAAHWLVLPLLLLLLYLLAYRVLIALYRAVRRPETKRDGKRSAKEISLTLLCAVLVLAAAAYFSFGLYYVLTWFFIPESAHSLGEPFQVLALVVGIVSAVLSLLDFWKPGQPGHEMWNMVDIMPARTPP
ncbi:hypothetical protein CC86DRAFT_25431 [Ophiobolus disseminans]|uniref:Uncharacterized protein n=1 Tax=Ophiobolus disseminans TaxID=1469910 RepID=A0A6A6ZYJ0_9PLEO|nr:hypothetical protein CC86DRAFT_25431 [Ophiobolus disseminans]